MVFIRLVLAAVVIAAASAGSKNPPTTTTTTTTTLRPIPYEEPDVLPDDSLDDVIEKYERAMGVCMGDVVGADIVSNVGHALGQLFAKAESWARASGLISATGRAYFQNEDECYKEKMQEMLMAVTDEKLGSYHVQELFNYMSGWKSSGENIDRYQTNKLHYMIAMKEDMNNQRYSFLYEITEGNSMSETIKRLSSIAVRDFLNARIALDLEMMTVEPLNKLIHMEDLATMMRDSWKYIIESVHIAGLNKIDKVYIHRVGNHAYPGCEFEQRGVHGLVLQCVCDGGCFLGYCPPRKCQQTDYYKFPGTNQEWYVQDTAKYRAYDFVVHSLRDAMPWASWRKTLEDLCSGISDESRERICTELLEPDEALTIFIHPDGTIEQNSRWDEGDNLLPWWLYA